MKIYSTSGVELHDVVVTRDAKHEQELMKSDFVSLKWSDVDSYITPTGSYIIPFADGIRYTLFGDCLPTQKNEGEYVYEPQFQHPKMILAHTPCLLATKNAAGEDVKDTDWTFVGGLATLLDGMQKIIRTELGKDFNFSIINAEDIAASASCTFSGVDILSAFTEICNQFECEYYVDWSNAFIYFGHIKRDMAITTPVLEVGVNINVPTINRNNEEVANCFIVRGGTRNITTKTASGNNVETDTRLTLDTAVYGADSIIDKRTDESQPKLVKTLIFDHIYPHLDLYVYDVRKRTRRLEDKNGKYIQNPDGTYKKYSIYYIKLAYKEGLEWKDFTSATREHIVNGKKLMASFEPNEGKGHSALAGREFEMIFHPQPVKINKNEAVEDTGIDIGKDYYEICYQQENDLILPNDDTLEPWGEAFPSNNGDKVVLFNILMGEEYLNVARIDLLEAANKEIVKLLADNNIYNVKSNSVTYDKNLSLGQHVILRNVDGSEIDSRITKIVTQLDIPSQVEFTIGTDILKGATQTLREDVKSISSKIGIISNSNSVSSATIQQILRALQDAEERMLHKDADDETPFKLTADRLEVVKNAIVDGMLNSAAWSGYDMSFGRGWGVDNDGNMQVESLEVRSALRVLELVYNRLSAEESEYVFTESGTIKELEPLGDGRYKAIMEKRGDTDFHAFCVGDVLRGIVNNLSNLGERGDYYTTWLHVESTDAQGDNSMVVSMYADSDCPSGKNQISKNYSPTSLMVVQRWGNSIPATKENHENPEYRAIIDLVDGKYVNRRQSCWYLSSNEKRIAMLDGVTQPKLSQNNYAAFFGLPYDIKTISGHSLNPTQPYLYARGAFIQDLHFIDYKGNVIRIERFRGEWDANVADSPDPYVSNSSTFDTVYHNNAKWECVVEQARVDEPSDTNTDWKLLQSAVEGESTPQYTLIPSVAVVQRDAEGVPDVDIVTCKVRKTVGDDTTTEVTDRLFYSINDGNPIQGSFVELKKDDGIEKITFMLLPKNVEQMGIAKFGESKFQITRIEAIVDVLNKAQRGAILRGPSEWKEDVEYMGGARGEEYQDMVVRTIDGVTEYFLCHYTHTNKDPHDASHQANSKWDADRPWQKSQVSDFVATRILYSEQIKADIMRVVNASIDDLIVGRLQTMEENGATIDISGGLMRVMKTGNIQPNIEFGLDADGYAVLKYYNNEGKLLYNLGPKGIMFEISVQWAYYTPISLYLQWSNLDDDLGTIMPFNPTSAYLWRQGIKKLGEIENYSAYWRDWISLQEDEKWQEEKFANDGKVVTAKAEEGKQPTSILSEGIYTVHTMPPTTTEGHVMPVIVKEYVDGKENRQFVIWNVRNNNTWHICMPDGSHYVGVRKLRQYLINTNQLSD